MLPVHNQADHIASVVAAYEAALDGPHELILVSNACRDESPAACRVLAERYSDVRAVDSDAGGWGLAVRLGLREARGAWVGYTNSARTTAEQLATLVREARACPDAVVKAVRRGRAGLRRVGSTLYNWECRLLYSVPGRDVNGTPKIFPRRFAKLLSLTRDDDLIDLEFMATCRREGYPVREVPVQSGRRHGGESTTRWRSALKLYAGAYRLRRELGQ